MDGAPYLISYCFASISMEENANISDMLHNLYILNGEKFLRSFWKLEKLLTKKFDKKKWDEVKSFPINKFSSRLFQSNPNNIKQGTFLDKLLKCKLE